MPLFIITNPTNNWISRSIVGITTKSSVKLSSRPTTRFIKSVVLSFPYFWVGEEVEKFSLSEKHTFCK
ncbi:hypothetical protein E4413_15430 [Leptospira interrogans]|uniref:Uncharacterized protein n=2 Tax=Leptospira interrogans TaxID=173 RepID=A0AAQ0AXQ6_LEPIR|nr:hypothetical protein C5473_15520 [Leptospira interrogans serovar Weerasinghe]KAA1290188.1 hypothetical protein C4X99_07015 [Leptospira interrogans serovar Geyaweera]MBE0303962.1 hypothetical protein [Leptospira interrogans serovar Yeoncheon]QCO34301.1 hypothetical protein E4414_15400 [Leptospira interrogans]QEH98956.1 hypothetical protein FWJ33_05595 [Leptospira interrogans serovar Hardjo]QOI33363.1 hypothetical protein LeptoLang_03415 [Leptospira interrogans serovar Icterohaemorrhagiae]QO